MADLITELIKYLHLGSRLDLKDYALSQILSLTGSDEGLELILAKPEILVNLLILLQDNNHTISKDASLTLVNISANVKGSKSLISLDICNEHKNKLVRPPDNIVKSVLDKIFNPESRIADPCCMILSNLTRNSQIVGDVIDIMNECNITIIELINIFTKKNFNKHGAHFHYLGPVLSNLSQNPSIRKLIMDKDSCIVQKLFSFIEFNDSLVRRGGVIGTLKNCCFENDYHEWLLTDDVDILPRLLLPLAGNEEFDDEDNDKLPLELQYLQDDKKREEDPDIRCMLLEAITQLCAEKRNREFIRDRNTYIILRELHKWEKDRRALLACENLVDLLIRTEDEIGEDNLKNVDIPIEYKEKFDKLDVENKKEDE